MRDLVVCCLIFIFRGHPGAQRAQRKASQDTSMTSDLCNFPPEVAPSHDGAFTKTIVATGS